MVYILVGDCRVTKYSHMHHVPHVEHVEHVGSLYSLVPRLPRSRTQTLKLYRRGEPGIFFFSTWGVWPDKMTKCGRDNTVLSSAYPIHGSPCEVHVNWSDADVQVVSNHRYLVVLLSSWLSSISLGSFFSLLSTTILPVLDLHCNGVEKNSTMHNINL